MDIQQLKMILDAVRDVSGGAQWIAILWICKGYFITVVGFGVLAVAVLKALAILKDYVVHCTKQGETHALMTELCGWGWDRHDVARVRKWAERGRMVEGGEQKTRQEPDA